MSLHCINPHVFFGERGAAPEYVSDAPVLCDVCRQEFDLDDDDLTGMDDGTMRCQDCTLTCEGCGDVITDPDPIMLRCSATGKLEPYCTPECAAAEL